MKMDVNVHRKIWEGENGECVFVFNERPNGNINEAWICEPRPNKIFGKSRMKSLKLYPLNYSKLNCEVMVQLSELIKHHRNF